MPRYWIIAPHESDPPQLFDKVWQYDLANNLISIGWVLLGDVSRLSRTELAEKIASTYPDRKKGLVTKMIWSFYHDISVGDSLQKALMAVGKVSEAAVYSPGKSSGTPLGQKRRLCLWITANLAVNVAVGSNS
jgi:hypothetical protein